MTLYQRILGALLAGLYYAQSEITALHNYHSIIGVVIVILAAFGVKTVSNTKE